VKRKVRAGGTLGSCRFSVLMLEACQAGADAMKPKEWTEAE
jgi:hypothetical protein